MIYVAIVSAIAVALLYWTAPVRIEVSANRPKNWIDPQRRSLLPGQVKTESGESLDLTRKVIAKVRGKSAQYLGIAEGSSVIARKAGLFSSPKFEPGQVVIIKSKAEGGDNPYRLRQIESVKGDMVSFINPPGSDIDLKPRPKKKIFALVTHVEPVEIAT